MSEIAALSEVLGQKLKSLGWTITTAESCTGGGISAAITEIAGSSDYFNCAFITYSNESKSSLVKVPPGAIEAHGAVSKSVVEYMAIGAARQAHANMAIAVSGVAGPGGGSKEKPVGTVWIAISTCSNEDNAETTVWSQCFCFSGDRARVRQQSVKASLFKALELLAQKK